MDIDVIGICHACTRHKATSRATLCSRVIVLAISLVLLLISAVSMLKNENGFIFLAKNVARISPDASTTNVNIAFLEDVARLPSSRGPNEASTAFNIAFLDDVVRLVFAYVSLVLYLVLKAATGVGPISAHYATYLLTSCLGCIVYFWLGGWAEAVIRVVSAVALISTANQYWTGTTPPLRLLFLGAVSCMLITVLYLALPLSSAQAITERLLIVPLMFGEVLVTVSCTHAAITIRSKDGKPLLSLLLAMNACLFSLINNAFSLHFLTSRPDLVFISRLLDVFVVLPCLIPGLLRMDKDEAQELGQGASHAMRTRVCVVLVLALAILSGAAEKTLAQLENPSFCDPSLECTSSDFGRTCAGRILQDLDMPTAYTFGIIKSHMIELRSKPTPNASDVFISTDSTGAKIRMQAFGVLPILFVDEDMRRVPQSERLRTVKLGAEFLLLIKLPFLFPMTDLPNVRRPTEEESLALTQCAFGPDRRPPVLPWTNLSDESISHFAFGGIAAHSLTRGGNGLNASSDVVVSDYSWMEVLPVRPGYERYGGKAAFSATNGTLLSITIQGVEYTPASTYWTHAKWVYKSSAMFGVTLKDHLIGSHLLYSNLLVASVLENLSPGHPLRRFLRPHTFRAVRINTLAYLLLLPENGALHRTSALPWHAFHTAANASVQTARYVDFVDDLQARGMHSIPAEVYPWGSDLLSFARVVKSYVQSYVDVYWPTDADLMGDRFWDRGLRSLTKSGLKFAPPRLTGRAVFVKVIANFIVAVTSYHTSVGSAADYLDSAEGVTSKLQAGYEVPDAQAAVQWVNIGLVTGGRQPMLMDNYSHLLLPDMHLPRTRNIFAAFQSELESLAGSIESLNKERRFPTDAFNPRIAVVSVSV